MEKPTVPAFSVNPKRFVQEVIRELKKVTWPTRAETMKLTAVVIAISVVTGAFIGGLDTLFLKISSVLY